MRGLLATVVLLSFAAHGHIKLQDPPSFQVTDALGSPQKVGPCGEAGTATGLMTTVEAGSQLTVTWTETIFHPGHFRIGLAQSDADFITPTPVLSGSGTNCESAPIMSNPAAPILVDGLFPHTSASRNGYTTKVTVPLVSCDHCVLQLMQFMSSHAPPCFYYQCATLRIVMPDGGTPPSVDAGEVRGPVDAGAVDSSPPVGCGCSAVSGGGLALMLVFALAARRRRAP